MEEKGRILFDPFCYRVIILYGRNVGTGKPQFHAHARTQGRERVSAACTKDLFGVGFVLIVAARTRSRAKHSKAKVGDRTPGGLFEPFGFFFFGFL